MLFQARQQQVRAYLLIYMYLRYRVTGKILLGSCQDSLRTPQRRSPCLVCPRPLLLSCFRHRIGQLAEELACSPRYAHMLEKKRQRRKNDEASKPLQAYREEELQQMWLNFFGADRSYHLARKRFVYKGLMPVTAVV